MNAVIEPAQVLRLLQTLRDLDDGDQVLGQDDREALETLLAVLESPAVPRDDYDEGGEA